MRKGLLAAPGREEGGLRLIGKMEDEAYLGELSRFAPLRADHHIVSGLVPEVIAILCGSFRPGSLHLHQVPPQSCTAWLAAAAPSRAQQDLSWVRGCLGLPSMTNFIGYKGWRKVDGSPHKVACSTLVVTRTSMGGL